MKNVIKQIRKIKGVITVEPAGENMAVVVFETEPEQPKSIKPEELVDGEIYVSEGLIDGRWKRSFPRIIRFGGINSHGNLLLKTQICNDGDYFTDAINYISKGILRPATIEEKLKLIGEELRHGYNHSVKTK